MIEITFGFVKPDAYPHRKQILEEFILPSGLSVVCEKDYLFTEEKARQHYQNIRGEDFFDSVIDFTVYGYSGLNNSRYGERRPALTALYIFEGENAVEKLKEITGPTEPTFAKIEVIRTKRETIRSKYGKGLPDNAFHRSFDYISVKEEIERLFERNEVPEYVWKMLEQEPYAQN